jgi:hypothetical protein
MKNRKSAAQVAYERMTDNDPHIHSNRFLSWKELSRKERITWRRRAKSPTTNTEPGDET